MSDASAFDDLMGMLDCPMFVVTARRGEQRVGCLIGFASQASIEPQWAEDDGMSRSSASRSMQGPPPRLDSLREVPDRMLAEAEIVLEQRLAPLADKPISYLPPTRLSPAMPSLHPVKPTAPDRHDSRRGLTLAPRPDSRAAA